MQTTLQIYTGQGAAQMKGGRLQESSGKYFDNPVNQTANFKEAPMSKGKRGGTKISRVIAMDYDTYHRTKGGLK